MTTVSVELDDDDAATLEKVHGDLSVWLAELASSELRNQDRIDARDAVQQLMNTATFIKAVAKLARVEPDFKSSRAISVRQVQVK